jgi:hypothetical protein
MLIWAVVYVLIWMSILGLITWLSKYEKNHSKEVVASKTTLFHVLHSYKTKNPYYLYGSYRK